MDSRSLRLRRRTFLKALSLGIAMPVAARLSSMAVAAPQARPKRFLAVFLPHGAPVEHFDPMGSGTNFSLSEGTGQRIYAPLEAYKSNVTLLRGVNYVGYDNHPAIAGALTNGTSRSVEHAIAQGLGVQAHVLGVVPQRVNDFGPDSQLFMDGGQWIKPEMNAVKAADKLLSKIGGGPQPADPGTEFRNLAIDLNIAEVDAMRREVAGLTREETKLSTHLEALQKLKETGDGTTDSSCTMKPTLPAVDLVRQESQGNDAYFLDEGNVGKIYEAQLEVAANALLCGTAQVMGLQTMYVNADISCSFMGLNEGHHQPLSHSIDAPGRDRFAQAQKWFVQKFEEKVLKTLNQPDPADTTDPTRTALDNTLIYFFTEISDGNSHVCHNNEVWVESDPLNAYIPLLMIGGASGALKTGQVLEVPDRSHADVLLTMADAMGVSLPDYGANTTGIIQELKA